MEGAFQIVFRNLDPSDAIAARIRERMQRLERFYPRIISCRVSVETPHRRHRRGNIYRVRINLRVPGRELVVGFHNSAFDGGHKDMYVVIRDAFNEMTRRLEEHARRRRGEVKVLEEAPQAEVVRLVRDGEQGFGFIRTSDGLELYFHENSVLNHHYDDLKIGSKVRFVKEAGEDGPQASTVEIIGRQGRQLLKVA